MKKLKIVGIVAMLVVEEMLFQVRTDHIKGWR